MHWIIQTNFGKDSNIQDFIDALKKSHASYETFEYVPFSNELPEFKEDSSQCFIYGSTSVNELASKTKKWKPFLNFNEINFNYTAWSKHYGSLLLNDPKDSHQMTIKDFIAYAKDKKPSTSIFVRPNKDLKEFNGQVTTIQDFLKWSTDVLKGGFSTVSKDTKIVISVPHGISAEYRLFMDASLNKVIACSQYKKNESLYFDSNVPDKVLKKAIEITKVWSPADLFTLDLAVSGDGIWIVEAQSIHSSGFYKADLMDYIKNIEDYYQRKNLVLKNTKKMKP